MEKQQINVVFVITDDQGYGDLGCTGNAVIQTPNIDRLYKESIRFTNYHVGPTCAPTRAGLMTGRYHNSTGVWHTIGGRSLLRSNEVSLADIFRLNGYRTGIFGKWHLGDNYPYRPHDRGFDEAIVHGGGGIGQTPDYWNNDYFDDTYFDHGQPTKFKGYCTDVFFKLGLDFIERHKDQPFFCYIPTNAPHSPLQVEDKYIDMYRRQVPEDRARFYGMISNIDENVGLLREKLAEWGLAERTIVIFMTDNGTANGCTLDDNKFVVNGYNAGMRGTKGSPYEGGHRVPFFLHSPNDKSASGRDINQLTANIDILPTLLDLCRLPLPDDLDLDGKSLLPLLEGKQKDWDDRFIVTDSQRVPNPIKWKDSAVMRGNWRLINGKELYDIEQDPEQRVDQSDHYPDIAIQLCQDYEVWWDRVSKQFHEEIPISIGSPHELITRISSHDWRGDVGDVAWNQGEIRAGKICNSYVELMVETSGTYTFELRRWPVEEGSRLTEGLEGELEGWYSGGRAISVKRASIEVADQKASKEVSVSDSSVSFAIDLQEGATHLQTYLKAEDGNVLGAYYVYIRRMI